MTSADMQEVTEKAWNIQKERFKEDGITFNSEMDIDLVKKYCGLDADSKDLLKQSVEAGFLSGRGQTSALKVARTIADMEGAEKIGFSHIAESIHYKSAVTNYVN